MKETYDGTKPKSAPCTPCGDRDVELCGNDKQFAVKLNEPSAGMLHQAVSSGPHVTVSNHQHSHRPAAVGCSPVELNSQLHRSHHTDDVHQAVNDTTRRQRHHRARRTANNHR